MKRLLSRFNLFGFFAMAGWQRLLCIAPLLAALWAFTFWAMQS
ncbi:MULTISPECIES: hypothetical protein [Deefgea]|nr:MULTISPECIES: hypothetical protein [Deefgea]